MTSSHAAHDDARTDAALAIEHALDPAQRQRILDRFRHGNLDGAHVADILDILDNHDALLEQREPFYEDGLHRRVQETLGWPAEDADDAGPHAAYLRARLIGYAVLALALLAKGVPSPGAVTELVATAMGAILDERGGIQ